MSKTVGITWSIPLSALATGATAYGERLNGAIAEMMGEEAQRATEDMQAGARWNDQSGHARGSLKSSYERRGDEHVLAFYTLNDEYGWVLELARAGRFAIIRPTMNAYESIVFGRAQALVGG